MHEIPLKARYFERVYQKAFKKVTLFFLSNPVPVNGQNGPGTSDQLLFRLQNKFRKIPLVMHYLAKFDDLI